MSVHAGDFAVTSTGQSALVDLPFLPDEVELTISEQDVITENNDARLSIGFATDEYQSADSILINANGKYSRKYRNDSDICLSALATPGGNITSVLKIAHVGFVNEGGSNKWKYNVLSYNGSYDFTVSVKFRA
jgi:hypothetical protein